MEFTENNSLFHRVSLLFKDKKHKQIVKLFDSARYKTNKPPVDRDYYERGNSFECLVLAYCFFQMEDISKSKLFYDRYEQIKDIGNQTQMDYRFNFIQDSFHKYLINELQDLKK